ncbi:MAG: hypothetical protein ACKOXB_07645 [Flavobacteriales bacterium]
MGRRKKSMEKKSMENEIGSNRLTAAKLKTYKGLEHLSDEKAEEMVHSIKLFSNVLLEYMRNMDKENS